MKKNIVIVSNPFGYGPTGKAIVIAEAFLRLPNIDVIFVGNSFAREILPKNIRYIRADERDERALMEVFAQIENPFIVSSQNRFAIYAAKKLGISCAFLDGLAWFWDQIPLDHLIADHIFWMRYPGIEKKLPRNHPEIYLIPAVIDVGNIGHSVGQTIVHIGGCENPFRKTLPTAYLDMLSYGLNAIYAQNQRNILLVGGAKAIKYLETKVREEIRIDTLKHDDFIVELKRSNHFITTAGQTATLEAFALEIPVSFLLPTNLSQLALTNFLSEHGASGNQLRWSSYIPSQSLKRLLDLSEREALSVLSGYAETVLGDERKLRNFKNDFKNLFYADLVGKPQKDFIQKIGINGAEKIVKILDRSWGLS